MGKLLSLKVETLKDQLEMLKCEMEAERKSGKSRSGGLRELKGVLRGKGNFSEEDIASAKVSFSEAL